jgi:ADP-ribose pyrophosphatase
MKTKPYCTPAIKLTEERFVNLFRTDLCTAKGRSPWIFASRKKCPVSGAPQADAAIVVAVVRCEGEARLVMTREFRAPLSAYELSLPAGLVDAGETPEVSARREFREETGMELTRVVHVSPPLASSAGLTDETVAMVYAEAEGTPSSAHQTEHEDIEILLMSLSDIRTLVGAPTEDVISSRLYPVLIGCLSAGCIALPGLDQVAGVPSVHTA